MQMQPFLLLFLIPFLTHCANLPTQEMSDARQAINAIYKAKIENYVPDSLQQAELHLAQAETYLQQNQFHQAREAALLTKEKAVQIYNAGMAIEQAKMIWQQVEAISYIADVDLLKNAEEAAQKGQLEKTENLAKAAYEQGENALNQAYLQKAQLLIEEFEAQTRPLYPGEIAILKKAKQAHQEKKGQKAHKLVDSLMKDKTLILK